MEEKDFQKMPYDIVLCSVKGKTRNIVCQRYFQINNVNMKKAKSMEFFYAFADCVHMVKDALADASSLFLTDQNYVFYVNNTISAASRYTTGDIIYIESEGAFYEYKNGLNKIKEEAWMWHFIPLSKDNYLEFSFYFNSTKGEKKLIAQASIDLSIYPRYIASKIDLTGKSKYWENSRTLIWEIIHIICISLTTDKQ